MKLEPCKDLEPIPGLPGNAVNPNALNLNDPIENWISQFPYHALGKDLEIHGAYRCGEMRNENKEYRRLRITVSLCEWIPYKKEE